MKYVKEMHATYFVSHFVSVESFTASVNSILAILQNFQQLDHLVKTIIELEAKLQQLNARVLLRNVTGPSQSHYIIKINVSEL